MLNALPSVCFPHARLSYLLTDRHLPDMGSLSGRRDLRIPSITERHLLLPESFPSRPTVCLAVNLPETEVSGDLPGFHVPSSILLRTT
jgi:hypothetical protein